MDHPLSHGFRNAGNGADGQAASPPWMATDEYKILVGLSSVKGVRLSVVKAFWTEVGELQECPENADSVLWAQNRVMGTITKWQNIKEGVLRIRTMVRHDAVKFAQRPHR